MAFMSSIAEARANEAPFGAQSFVLFTLDHEQRGRTSFELWGLMKQWVNFF
jgi:hypothetical protein